MSPRALVRRAASTLLVIQGAVGCTPLTGPPGGPSAEDFALWTINGAELPQVVSQGSDALGPYKYIVKNAVFSFPEGVQDQAPFSSATQVAEQRSTGTAEQVLSDGGILAASGDTLRLMYRDGTTDIGIRADTIIAGEPLSVVRFGSASVGAGPTTYVFRSCSRAAPIGLVTRCPVLKDD